MASAKELKKKIRSISNTKKITRTMELVATVKSKRTGAKVAATAPYSTALAGILADLARAGSVSHPLLAAPAGPAPTVVLAITANRGLCGGYNTNVLGLTEDAIEAERTAGGPAPEVYMAGRKGIVRFRFLGIPVKESFLGLDDKATFADAADIAGKLMARFRAGEIGKVLVVSTRYISAASQKPEVLQLLPIVPPKGESPEEAGAPSGAADYIFEPGPGPILDALLPMSVKAVLYRLVIEASASEQVARRLAMKLATDNAEEMIKFYNRFYNRTRQAGITQQINEIVSGAQALD